VAREIDADALHLNWVPAARWSTNPPRFASDRRAGPDLTIASGLKALMRSAAHEVSSSPRTSFPAMTASR